MRLHVWGLATLAGLACLTCGGSSGGSTPSSPSGGSSATAPTIAVTGQNGAKSFFPNPSGFGGQMVAFRNDDTVMHRVVLNDGSADTGDIAPGATSRAVLMPASGTNYHCAIHPGMIGAVSAGGGQQPPACTGSYCDPY